MKHQKNCRYRPIKKTDLLTFRCGCIMEIYYGRRPIRYWKNGRPALFACMKRCSVDCENGNSLLKKFEETVPGLRIEMV